MKQYYSDTIQFNGNHYDFGLMQGELLKKSPILENRKKQWSKSRKRHFHINKQEAIQLFSNLMPSMLDELQGLADALNWSIEDALIEFGGYYVDYEQSGCSILTGSKYYIRNYDSHPGYYEGRYLIYQPTDTGYATIGPSMQITGRTDGMNEKGLVVGYNFINRVGSENGFVCNMICRIILETCANVQEAIVMLKKIPHRTSFSYVLLDQLGESYVVEASPRKVVARKATVSTNHFELLTEENRYRMDDSLRRWNTLKTNQRPNLDVIKAYRLLNDQEKEIFSHQYDASAGTIHTSAYLPVEKKALFAIGNNQLPVIIDFNHLLHGGKMNIKQMKGKLQFHIPFVNMEKQT
ncbi:linear amide C-N hydrolase [Ornithinibacillus gellani]|uniref:C45 family autoproteolytic acyltransferase/hydolase n=1 Tax=Ornithinibacillus gellani TaxID=2293253 RepID=UPI000F49EF9B|nr:C45 family peptidase [Ornithinibacillus gellani]TQS75787.1 linear amide C-N hydrolase [Ornithinibacillus gellani]